MEMPARTPLCERAVLPSCRQLCCYVCQIFVDRDVLGIRDVVGDAEHILVCIGNSGHSCEVLRCQGGNCTVPFSSSLMGAGGSLKKRRCSNGASQSGSLNARKSSGAARDARALLRRDPPLQLLAFCRMASRSSSVVKNGRMAAAIALSNNPN